MYEIKSNIDISLWLDTGLDHPILVDTLLIRKLNPIFVGGNKHNAERKKTPTECKEEAVKLAEKVGFMRVSERLDLTLDAGTQLLITRAQKSTRLEIISLKKCST